MLAGYGATAEGPLLIDALCAYWEDEVPSQRDGNGATIMFPYAAVTLVPADGGIAIAVCGREREVLERVGGAVAKALNDLSATDAAFRCQWSWQ